jgi:peptidoglycan/LPS O-acetylase OafA/YrhL
VYVERQDFLPGVHILRGLAAVATIFFHLRFMGEGREVNYLSFVEQFGAGVTLFFILSCFSLFHSTSRKLQYPNWVAGYVLRRFYRIYPLFLGMLIFYLAVLYAIFGKIYSVSEILLNASVLYQFYAGQHASIVWAGWTIGVEVTFYCIFPLLFTLSRSRAFWIIALIVATVLSAQIPPVVKSLGLDYSYAYMSFPRQLFVFILGGVVYLLANKQECRKRNISLFISLGLFLLWGLSARKIIEISPGSDLLPLKALALGSFVYYFYDKGFLYNRFTRFLGESSYTIYLSHPVVILATKPYVSKIYELNMPVDIAFLFSFLVVLAVVLIVSFLINKYFEMPVYYYGVKRAKKVEQRGWTVVGGQAVVDEKKRLVGQIEQNA